MHCEGLAVYFDLQIGNLQAESPEEDHNANMEEMGNAQGEAEEYTYHSGPAVVNMSAKVCFELYLRPAASWY